MISVNEVLTTVNGRYVLYRTEVKTWMQQWLGQVDETIVIRVSNQSFTNLGLMVLFAGIFLSHGAGNVGTIMCLLALIWQFLLGRKTIGRDENNLLRVFVLWAGVVFFSTLHGLQPFHWISRWANLYVWCSLPLGLLMVLRRNEKWNKIAFAVGIVVLTVLCGLMAYEGIMYHRRAGAIVETNVMAMGSVLSVTLPCILVCFLDERVFGKYRWLVLPAFVICNMGLLYNQTRGAWIACGLMYLVATILYFRRDIEVTTNCKYYPSNE